MKRTLTLLAACFAASACSGDRTPSAAEQAVRRLNASLMLAEGAYKISYPRVDATVEIARGAGETVHAAGGTTIDRRLHFSTVGTRVVAAGFRFGRVGPISVIPATVADLTLDFSVGLPDSICGLDGHPVECHEFAITANGQVSRGRVSLITLTCGSGCDNPDCGGAAKNHLGTVSWVGPDSRGHCGRAMALENTPIQGGSGRVLWIGGSATSIEGVVLQVPFDVSVGSHDICSDPNYYVQFTSQLAMAALWKGHPRGGRGSITVTRHSKSRIVGSFSFTGHNVKGLVDVTVTGTFDLPKHGAGLLGE